MIQVLIPMSGQGLRFKKAGYALPKPAILVNSEPMIQRLLKKFPTSWDCTFVLGENHRDSGLETLLRRIRPKAKVLFVAPNNEGPHAALEAGLKVLDINRPVLVSYCDYGLKWDPWDFEEFVVRTNCDACLISYRGFHAHYLSPMTYAYSKMRGEFVAEVREKGSFTDQRENEFASCGAYYFKNVPDLAQSLAFQRANGMQVNGEFYTSLTVEALLQLQPEAHCRVYEVDGFYQWGTPEDLQDFEYWERTYTQLSQGMTVTPSNFCSQILITMAGRGSRLTENFKKPKPLVEIGGRPMYRRAVESLPLATKTVYVTLAEIAQELPLNDSEEVVVLDATPPGQALTAETGAIGLDGEKDFIVSACDHSIVLGKSTWPAFIKNPNCDAAIFTIRDFPGTRRKPNDYSYVSARRDEGPFGSVTKVSVKAPITANPRAESLLVGTFWFKNADIFKKGMAELKKQAGGDGQLSELYLDGIFSCLLELGMTVREIPLAGYINWGDPDSLKEAIYWDDIFMGRRSNPRAAFPGCT